jgi:hypothetical protein
MMNHADCKGQASNLSACAMALVELIMNSLATLKGEL